MKGKIFGTCGHKLSAKWFDGDKGAICIKDTDREGRGCLSYMVVCPKCLKWYQEEGLIVFDKKPQDTALYAALRR